MAMEFSAADSAIGYLYQVRLALLLLLGAEYDGEISVEVLDDVAFEREGQPTQLLQLKHHMSRRGSLSDASQDLWKTLRVWTHRVKCKTISLPAATLTLITTGSASPSSIAERLRAGQARDPEGALRQMLHICTTSSNRDNKEAYEEFQSLTPQQQKDLAHAIYVLDGAPTILNAREQIKRKLCLSTHRQRLESLLQRVEGWWLDRVVKHMTEEPHATIRFEELQSQIAYFADQLKPDALPVDFRNLTADQAGMFLDDRRFVRQLSLIALSERRVGDAKRDYYRAYEQRSKWVRVDLILVSELQDYEGKLIEEWQRHFGDACDSLDGTESETQLQDCGLRTYRWMELEANFPIRTNCPDLFLMRGSYHMLADEPVPRVGWHPQYADRLNRCADVAAPGSAT